MVSAETSGLLTSREFARQLSVECGLRPGLSDDSRFIEDLGVDSLGMLNLIIFIEELARGYELATSPEFPIIRTLSDAYSFYLSINE